MRGLILLFGDPPSAEMLQSEAKGADLIIAADGAVEYALKSGIIPDVLIGDFDSAAPEALARIACERISLSPEKDETDGQAALDLAIQRGCTKIALLGAAGGRPDHALAQMALLRRACRAGVDARMKAGDSEVYCAGVGRLDIQGAIGDWISVLPSGDVLHIHSTQGLKYPVHDGWMRNDNTLGVSNELIQPHASIEIGEGEAIIIHTRR